MAHPGITYTFEAQGHKEYYTVTNDSAQVIVITDGMELVDPVPQSEPEPAPAGVYGSAAANPLPTAGGPPEPVEQPQAQSSGRPFRISVLAGASRKAGGFMAVSLAASSRQAACDATTQPPR